MEAPKTGEVCPLCKHRKWDWPKLEAQDEVGETSGLEKVIQDHQKDFFQQQGCREQVQVKHKRKNR